MQVTKESLMGTTVIAPPVGSVPTGLKPTRLSVILIMGLWFVLVVSLGAVGAFVTRAGTPPFPIALGVAVPLLLFFAGLRLSPSFREFVLALDLRLIVAMQAWRWAGLGFISLYAYGVLPALFALPAGLGDMAIGVTAPWILLGLLQRPGFLTSATFIRWNLLGILDLAVALSLGSLSATLSTGAAGEISSAPMAALPLLLIPAFLVPLFLMLHTAALMQSRRAVARGRAAG
jgi:hypothetical protein